MSNESWVRMRLKHLDVTLPTKKEQLTYHREREAYMKKRNRTGEKLGQLRSETFALESELQEAIPILPQGKYIHSGTRGCGLKSVFKLGEDTNGENVYYCLFCEKDFQLDETRNHDISKLDELLQKEQKNN